MSDFSPFIWAFILIPWLVYTGFLARGPRSSPWRDATNFAIAVLGFAMLTVSFWPLLSR